LRWPFAQRNAQRRGRLEPSVPACGQHLATPLAVVIDELQPELTPIRVGERDSSPTQPRSSDDKSGEL
jgi:hypothetical protein